MKKISVVGLGWLGLPLAQALLANGHQVQGSKSSSEGVEQAQSEGVECQLFNTTLDFSLRNPKVKSLFSVDTLVLTLPPTGHHGHAKYPMIMAALAKTAEYCGAKQIIFTSSTSVYGQYMDVVNEFSMTLPITESAKAVLKAEQAILAAVKIPVTIVRLGGLLGGERTPMAWMARKDTFDRPHQCVNLVDRKDAVAAICAIIEAEPNRTIYNVVSPIHPTRYEYYTRIAVDHRLPLPTFTEEVHHGLMSKAPYVDGQRICQALPFNYQYSIYPA